MTVKTVTWLPPVWDEGDLPEVDSEKTYAAFDVSRSKLYRAKCYAWIAEGGKWSEKSQEITKI